MRGSGILLHISSLPGPYGIGTIGKSAYQLIDFLAKAGQKYWQVLPLGPTSYGDSPYQTFSAFAGNPYFIDLDTLVEEGYLEKRDLKSLAVVPDPHRVDFERIYKTRFPVLEKAYDRFIKKGDFKEFKKFIEENRFWLEDYALFMALKSVNVEGNWFGWTELHRIRDKETLEEANAELHKIRDNFIQKKVIFGKESVSFNIPDFKKLSVYMQTEVLYELLKKYNLGKANIVELLKLVNSSKANHEVLFKKDLTFVKEYNKIYFFFKELIDESINIVIHELKKYQITDNIAINVTKKTTENITNDNSICYNSDKLPLVVRSRKPADKIKLSQGYKKVKDLLIDKKIGILQRKRVLILEDDSHEILAVLGIKKSEKLKEIKVKDILISMEEKTNGQFY
jgi:tRNA(Ile)-lysidine synthetase-like protein